MENFEKSDLAFWHDQKHGDFNPETHTVFSPGENEYNDRFNLDKKNIEPSEQRGAQDVETEKGEGHLESLVGNLNDAELQDGYKEDEEQKALLADRIETAKDLILEALNKAEAYVQAVRKVDFVAKSMRGRELDGAEYRSSMQNADASRRFAHEALISSITIANRYLRNNFASMDSGALAAFEEKERMANKPILKLNRFSVAPTGICPSGVDLSNRDSIGRWAYDIYDSLTQLKKDISA